MNGCVHAGPLTSATSMECHSSRSMGSPETITPFGRSPTPGGCWATSRRTIHYTGSASRSRRLSAQTRRAGSCDPLDSMLLLLLLATPTDSTRRCHVVSPTRWQVALKRSPPCNQRHRCVRRSPTIEDASKRSCSPAAMSPGSSPRNEPQPFHSLAAQSTRQRRWCLQLAGFPRSIPAARQSHWLV